MTISPDPAAAAAEFDRWAATGRAESMADGHGLATRAAIAEWVLDASSHVLDVGCGNGWAVRLLLERGAGRGVGVDVSPGMIARAQELATGDTRGHFAVASGDALPLGDDSVTHVLSVESLYYYPDPGAALAEWARVAGPGAELAIMVELYRENRGSHAWIDALDVDVHLLGADEYADLARAAGWRDVRWRQFVDPRPVRARGDFVASRYWPNYEMYLDYRQAGSLLLTGRR